jgi:hypothetical protein
MISSASVIILYCNFDFCRFDGGVKNLFLATAFS